MCLIPPREVPVFDEYAAAAEAAIQFEGIPEPDRDHTSARGGYRPIGVEAEAGIGERIEEASLASDRLLLQIVVVAVVFGGLALIVGPSIEDEVDTGTSKSR